MKRIFACIDKRRRRPKEISPNTVSTSDPEPALTKPASAIVTNNSKPAPSNASTDLTCGAGDAEPIAANPASAPALGTTHDSKVTASWSARADAEALQKASRPATAPTNSAGTITETPAPGTKIKSSGAALQNVKLFFEGLEKGLAGISIPGVEAITGIPLLIIKYYEEADLARDNASELVVSINDLRGVLEPGDLTKRVGKLIEELEAIGKSLDSFKDLTRLQVFSQRAAVTSTLHDANVRLGRAIGMFTLGSHIATETHTKNINKGVAELVDATKYANIELLKRADGSSWDPEKTCLRDTRVNIVDDLVGFASSPTLETPERIQLVTGVLGCGKSAVAHTVSERCHAMHPRILGAAFMFSSGAEARRTPDLVVSTIVHTLCGQYPDFAHAVSAAIEEDRSVLLASITRQFRALLLEPTKAVASSIGHTVTIVIDALDEAVNDESDAELLRILAGDSAELPSNVRMIVTSRPLPEIMMHLENKPHIHARRMELWSPSNLEDISLFARHALASIAEKRTLGVSWPGEELVHSFLRKAEGLFIWVTVTCRFILKAINPTKQLQQLVGNDSSQRLGSEVKVANKMANLYTDVLAACPWDDEDFAENYQLLMGAILSLKNPLSPCSIKSLLALDNAFSITDTLRSLSPILTGVTEAGDGDVPLQIIHDSFRGFSTSEVAISLSASRPQFKIDMVEHNQRLALQAIRFLSRELPALKSIVDGLVAVINQEESNGVPRPQMEPSLNRSVTEPQRELVEALDEFMKTEVRSWIVLCASKGGFQGISAILDWYTSLSIELPSSRLVDVAALLPNLSIGLKYLNRLEEALSAIREAVNLNRQFAKDRPTAFIPDLTLSLNNFSLRLSDLGYREEALATNHEASGLFRQLAIDRPAAFTPNFAMSLSNLSSRLSDLGYREDALAAAREAVELHRQLARDQPGIFTSDLALSLNNLSLRLSDAGSREEALATIRESSGLYRQLAIDRPATFTPNVASSLSNLSLRLSDLGYREDALAAVREAVNLHRQLARDRPAVFVPNLAISLSNLSVRLSDLDHREDALSVIREAVELHQQLAKGRPAVFTPDLANSLNTLSVQLSGLDHREEALAAIRKATELYRQLAKDRGAAFTPNLANSLNTLSFQLSELGHREEALTTICEAVNLRRQLAKGQPAVFTHDLATSLNNLSIYLSDLGQFEKALVAIREAVELRRKLAKERPDASIPDLADALSNFSLRLSELGHREESLTAIREAVELHRQLAQTRPAVFAPDLANSLNNLSKQLSSLGHREEALVAIREATDLYRQLAKDRRAAFTPDLAMSLHNLSVDLSSLGYRGEALDAIQQATELFRELAKDRPTKFTPDLASSLNNLSLRLTELGQHEGALAAIREAVDLRRQLARSLPAAFTPDLAMSLSNLSTALGSREGALDAIREAVHLYRQLSKERPAVFTNKLAGSLRNLSHQLLSPAHREEALAVIREAVELRRQLAKDRPAAFTRDLAISVNDLFTQLADLGHREEAVIAIREVVTLYRQLAKERPPAFIPDLAKSLYYLSLALSALSRHEEALSAAREVVELCEPFARAHPDAFNYNYANSLGRLALCLDSVHYTEEAADVRRSLRALEERMAPSQE